MITITIHWLAWLCFVFGIFVLGIKVGLLGLQKIRSELVALVEEFHELYDGDLSGEAVSLLMTKLRELSKKKV